MTDTIIYAIIFAAVGFFIVKAVTGRIKNVTGNQNNSNGYIDDSVNASESQFHHSGHDRSDDGGHHSHSGHSHFDSDSGGSGDGGGGDGGGGD